jgi:hypothetical protein
MAARLGLRLDQRMREAVAERYEQARSAIERTNCQMVLLADEGRSIVEIAWLVRRGREHVTLHVICRSAWLLLTLDDPLTRPRAPSA